MALTAAASGFVVFLLSVQVIQGLDGWGVTYTSTQICAVKGSTVNIGCSYTYPSTTGTRYTGVEKEIWYTKMNGNVPVDLKKSWRVQYSNHKNDCTLTIRDLRQSDSAVYKFRFITNQAIGYTGLPGVTLSVTDPDLQVQVRSTRPKLKCHSRCVLPDHHSYVWFRNDRKIWTVTSSSYSGYINSADNYSCAVKQHEQFRSPPVYAPKLPSVSVSPSAEIVENSSVNLTCSSDANPAANYTWHKKNGNPHLDSLSEEPQLVFSKIQSSDSGEYYCTADNGLGWRTSNNIIINVKYAPRLPSVSVRPSGEIIEGSSVTLTCSSDANPAANYTWYKENQTVYHGENGVYDFLSSSEDRGTYYCRSENQHGQINSSSLFVDVQYAPKHPSVSVNPSEVVEGSSVNLTCSSDANPAATFTWYKENQTLPQGPTNIYLFPSIRLEDSGIYHCKSENKYGRFNSTAVHIDVQYAPRLPSVSVSPSAEIMEGSSVNLTCNSDANPAATFTWYKENEDSLRASGQIFTITDIRAEHSGNYYCEAENKRGRHNSTLHPIVVSRSMKSVAAGSITAIFLVIIFLLAFLFIRRKKSLKKISQPKKRPDDKAQVNTGAVYDVPPAPRQRPPSEQQDDLCYVNVSFSKNQEDPLYSNVRLNQTSRHKEEEEDEDDVEYTVVDFKSASAATESIQDETEEDASVLYSTVVKKPRV